MTLRGWFGALVIATSMGMTGCVTQDVALRDQDVDVASRKALTGKQSCTLPHFTLIDARDKKGLGWIGGHELLYPELEDYMARTLEVSADRDERGQPLMIEINRAYIETHPSSLSFQLVLRVRTEGGVDAGWRVYRGNASEVAWWGNKGELGSYVEKSSRELISKLVKAEGRCS